MHRLVFIYSPILSVTYLINKVKYINRYAQPVDNFLSSLLITFNCLIASKLIEAGRELLTETAHELSVCILHKIVGLFF
jgi:hypothetical protein